MAARQASLSFPTSWSLLKLKCIELVMPFNHLILCHPFLLLLISPSIRVFSWWAGSSHQVAKVLELQLQSFQWIFPWGLTGLISLPSKGLSRVFSSPTVQRHQFFDAQPSLLLFQVTWYVISSNIFFGSRITVESDCSHKIKTITPWKKSSDKPIKSIKKHRNHFANKGTYSQSYGLSSSHVLEERVGP